MGTEKLLTVEGAAKVLLVKPTTVRTWLKASKLKGMKMAVCGEFGKASWKPF